MENPETWLMNSFWGQASLLGILLGIVVWVIYAILSERLFGRRAMENERSEKHKWREAYETERTAHHVTGQNLTKALNTLETTDRLLKTMRQMAGGDEQ